MDDMMNDPYFTDGQGEYDEAEDEKIDWKHINKIALALYFIIPAFLWFIFYSLITTKLLGVTVLFLLIFCVINAYCKRFKIVWNIARGIWIFFAVISYIPAIFLMMFDNTTAMYGLKKAAFINGVTGMYSYLLPEELPEVCEDYNFNTIGNLPVQDTVSRAYLTFYTDAETIDEYRESCEDSDEYKKIDLSYWREGSGGVYYWFCRKVGLKEDIMNDVENNELYISTLSHSEFSPRGILLNRKRGLVAIFA